MAHTQDDLDDSLADLRRGFHRIPEPAWCEFRTTARLVSELEDRFEPDELHVGPDALAGEHRLAVPDDADLESWYERARAAGVDEDLLSRLEGGYTGAVAVFRQGDHENGPTVGLRVDIDGLPRTESDDADHVPVAESFRSEHEGAMHACGHDAHMTMGIGTIERVLESEFEGTLKVFFQPAEEVIGGGKAMAESDHIEDVDYLLAVHIGLDHPTGEVVAGIGGFLAVSHLEARFTGEPSHAGGHPEEGRNAIQAMATAVQNCYGIPRHSDGATRINVGVVDAGSAANIVAEEAEIVAEARGETTHLMEYMEEKAENVLETAAAMHDCEVSLTLGAKAPSAESDAEIAALVADSAGSVEGVDSVLDHDDLGGSEDATFLMQAVQQRGGKACYVGVGTDHPGGHHTATFDVDEASLRQGVETLAGAIERIGRERP
ncbi:amidohydrolase [Saliphagus sp. LR7]|uniref:amidohydrolase n=1 Tax=Saliphagus sp. LR7 TaxID=2282654 RepID=UPI000DF752E5|nr:amidohydrolase [Saliphagus sp. LR7]